MKLFDGIAIFSSLVPVEVKNLWRSHGGIVIEKEDPEERRLAQWFFCNGLEDPLLARLSSQTSVVFHANWVLASAANGFPLPLAEYVLDGRFGGLYAETNPCKESLGSSLTGIYRALPEINVQIDNSSQTNHSVPTRLAATSESRNFRKRPYASSPEHLHKLEARLIKKSKLNSSEDSGTGLETSGSQSAPTPQESSRAYAYDRSMALLVQIDFHEPDDMLEIGAPADSLPLCSALLDSKAQEAILYSDTQENCIPKSSNFASNKAEHDDFRLCEKLINNGQVRSVMGCPSESLSSPSGSTSQLLLKNPVGSGSGPDNSGAGSDVPRGSSENFWLSLIQNPPSPKTDADDDIPTIGISDALAALGKLGTSSVPDGNDDILLFVKGIVRDGRKFDVDKTDRRKTI